MLSLLFSVAAGLTVLITHNLLVAIGSIALRALGVAPMRLLLRRKSRKWGLHVSDVNRSANGTPGQRQVHDAQARQ